jgi:hypothetical protein
MKGWTVFMKKLLAWRDIVDRPMPEQPRITEKIRSETLKESARFKGGVRLATGRFWTDEEYERARNKVLTAPLP